MGEDRVVLVTDTVGFIQKLPTTLIAAFRATLEEANEADLILHVVDVSHSKRFEQVASVDGILKEIGLSAVSYTHLTLTTTPYE